MTTKTDWKTVADGLHERATAHDIKLPPLPPRRDTSMFWYEGSMRAYARAAIEADRQGRMPSDEEILDVWGQANEDEALPPRSCLSLIRFTRAFLARYGSQPVEPMKQLYAQSATLGEYGIIPECDTSPAAAPVAQEPGDTEHSRALKEAKRNAASEAYFKAGDGLLWQSASAEATFEKGFDRGYDAAQGLEETP